MRTAVTIAKKRSGESVLLAGLDVPLHEQRARMKPFFRERTHKEFSEVTLFTSDGSGSLHKRFATAERLAAIAAANVPAAPASAPEATHPPAPEVKPEGKKKK